MNRQKTLVFFGAHPDDESFGIGSTLAQYAAANVKTYYVCSTSGELGTVEPQFFKNYSSIKELREYEMKCAAEVLGLTGVYYLGYRDSGMHGSESNKHPDSMAMAPVDEVCYLFPELKVIQTHLGHPWIEEVVHNVIKYPNCYVMTNEYRAKYFPPEFVHHMNTRAQDKVMWASGHPIVTFEQSLTDVDSLPLRDNLRSKYLRENALRLFKSE